VKTVRTVSRSVHSILFVPFGSFLLLSTPQFVELSASRKLSSPKEPTLEHFGRSTRHKTLEIGSREPRMPFRVSDSYFVRFLVLFWGFASGALDAASDSSQCCFTDSEKRSHCADLEKQESKRPRLAHKTDPVLLQWTELAIGVL
jgi:hypothetical protein